MKNRSEYPYTRPGKVVGCREGREPLYRESEVLKSIREQIQMLLGEDNVQGRKEYDGVKGSKEDRKSIDNIMDVS